MSRATVEPAAAKPASAARVGLLQRCGQTPPTACPCEAEEEPQTVLHRWSSSPFASAEPTAPQIVQEALRSRSQALEPRARARMESRFGRSFGYVRVHSDSVAAESARAVGALAYTVGPHVVFGHRRYAPETTRGDRLLAHELVHVVQQSSLPAGTAWRSLRVAADDSAAERAARSASARGVAAAPAVQRASFGEAVARFFGGGTFSDEELLDYLTVLDLTERIEDDYDSDNKARAVVDRWRAGDPRFALPPARKILLVQEMISGFTGDDDERAILHLLEGSKDAEVGMILDAVGEGTLRSNFHTDEADALDRFLTAWRERTGVRDQDADAERSAGKIARVVVDQEATQTVTVIYQGGHRETDICSTGKGRCCVDAAAGGTGAACSETGSRAGGTNCTPVGEHTVAFQLKETAGGVKWWTEFDDPRDIALHEYSPVDGTALSHGCVRLRPAMARTIFDGAVPGTTKVEVKGLARPRCDHLPLQLEWAGDLERAGETPPDGETIDPYTREPYGREAAARERRDILRTRARLRRDLGLSETELLSTIRGLEAGTEGFSRVTPEATARTAGAVQPLIPRCQER